MKVYKEDKKLIEARKWFIVGAYLSGSPVGKISDDIGLSPGYVSRIVANFKKTGSPSVSQRTHRKERREYDLYDSDDEISDLYKLVPKNMNKKKKPAAKDVIAYVLYKAQKNEETIHRPTKWRLPTPPRDPNTQKDSPTHSIALPPSPPLCELAEPSEYSTKSDHTWTKYEDKILLAHVLTRRSGFRFKEAEDKLGGKHSADDCKQRWEILRDLILRGSQKVDSLF